ncbi:MAG TPA: tyrosine-type recombinase/integrase [Rhodocyclaceae bacterium]|nr:tyrosine-type recombinase/integrase [Rhodocyclaceae bacterium]
MALFEGNGQFGASPQGSPTSRANRRRLIVFLSVFVALAAVGLTWNFLRPAQYRADARIEITPAAAGPSAGERGPEAGEAAKPFLTEVQVLTSRPVLEQAVTRLSTDGHRLDGAGGDPVAALQEIVQVRPVAGTHVVELTAIGDHAELLAPMLDAHIGAYREHLAAMYRDSSGQLLADAEDEAGRLTLAVADKRDAVETFRARHDIVSLEREENQVLSRVKALATSLNNANERVAVAEGRLRALQEAAADGRAVVRARDNPTLASLEQRASQIRERFIDLRRRFTADYIALDPGLRAEAERLSELERQIAVERQRSYEAAIAEAREEVRSARETAQRIASQVAADRETVQQFTARFNEYRALQDELTELQALQRASTQRLTMLQASERLRQPVLRVLEGATPPLGPWRPLYGRDAGFVVGAAFLLGLLAMWFVELFNRQAPQPTMVLAQAFPGGMLRSAERPGALAHEEVPVLERPREALADARGASARELSAEEVEALLKAATDDACVAMLLLSCGLDEDEAIALRPEDVDRDARTIAVGGESARRVPLPQLLAHALAARAAPASRPLLANANGLPWTVADLRAEILCAAHDAGIDDAETVTPAALRHTYIAFLVRQGIRFADLAQLVGRQPAEAIAAYAGVAPPGPRTPLAEIELVMPALRAAGRSSHG